MNETHVGVVTIEWLVVSFRVFYFYDVDFYLYFNLYLYFFSCQ